MPTYGIERSEFELLLRDTLIQAIIQRRNVIRMHRDQRGDDRCWLDDFLVHAMVRGLELAPKSLSFGIGMRICKTFYLRRRETQADRIPADAILDQSAWDLDLNTKNQSQLIDELLRLQLGILAHAHKPLLKRTVEDDKALYSLLPEKIPADFRLPPEEEFLGTAKDCAGCPHFWNSHSACSTNTHDYHHWGPCSSSKAV